MFLNDNTLARVMQVAWEIGYQRGVRDATSDLDPADNPFVASDLTSAPSTWSGVIRCEPGDTLKDTIITAVNAESARERKFHARVSRDRV